MSREIQGSAFEVNDDDSRTWDEMGIGRQLVDADDYELGSEDADNYASRSETLDRDEAWMELAQLDVTAKDLSARIATRPPAGLNTFDPDAVETVAPVRITNSSTATVHASIRNRTATLGVTLGKLFIGLLLVSIS